MKSKNIFFILLPSLLLMLLINGCRKEIDTIKKVNPGNSATYPLNGEYFVVTDIATIANGDTTWTPDVFGIGYQKIMLYNTASNRSDSIWIDDLTNTWSYKVRISCNPDQKTFHVNDGTELYNGDNTTITNGKLILNMGKSKAGNKTDSIYMLIQWASDPTNLYRVSGVRRTGFQEDEP